MNAILHQFVERSQNSITEAEMQGVDPVRSGNPSAHAVANRLAPGFTRRDSATTLTRTSSNGRQSESVGFTTFVSRFDGLRIPPSPLNEY